MHVSQFMLKKDFLLHRTYIWKTQQVLTYVFIWLYSTQCLTFFPSINHLLHLCTQFLILFHLTQIRFPQSTHLLAFVFGDFNIHHKNWLVYSGTTDPPGELCHNFSISNDLTQMVKFPTWIPNCDSHSLALLDLFISSDASICSTMAFPPLGNSDHVVASVSIDFRSNCQRDPCFIAQLMTILVLIGIVFVII